MMELNWLHSDGEKRDAGSGYSKVLMMVDDKYCHASCEGRWPVRSLSAQARALRRSTFSWSSWLPSGARKTPRVSYPLLGETCSYSSHSSNSFFTVNGFVSGSGSATEGAPCSSQSKEIG